MICNCAIGVDIGVKNMKISIVHKGGIDVVINEASYRQTPIAIGFTQHERKIGDEAELKFKLNFKNTIVSFTNLLKSHPESVNFEKESYLITTDYEFC